MNILSAVATWHLWSVKEASRHAIPHLLFEAITLPGKFYYMPIWYHEKAIKYFAFWPCCSLYTTVLETEQSSSNARLTSSPQSKLSLQWYHRTPFNGFQHLGFELPAFGKPWQITTGRYMSNALKSVDIFLAEYLSNVHWSGEITLYLTGSFLQICHCFRVRVGNREDPDTKHFPFGDLFSPPLPMQVYCWTLKRPGEKSWQGTAVVYCCPPYRVPPSYHNCLNYMSYLPSSPPGLVCSQALKSRPVIEVFLLKHSCKTKEDEHTSRSWLKGQGNSQPDLPCKAG